MTDDGQLSFDNMSSYKSCIEGRESLSDCNKFSITETLPEHFKLALEAKQNSNQCLKSSDMAPTTAPDIIKECANNMIEPKCCIDLAKLEEEEEKESNIFPEQEHDLAEFLKQKMPLLDISVVAKSSTSDTSSSSLTSNQEKEIGRPEIREMMAHKKVKKVSVRLGRLSEQEIRKHCNTNSQEEGEPINTYHNNDVFSTSPVTGGSALLGTKDEKEKTGKIAAALCNVSRKKKKEEKKEKNGFCAQRIGINKTFQGKCFQGETFLHYREEAFLGGEEKEMEEEEKGMDVVEVLQHGRNKEVVGKESRGGEWFFKLNLTPRAMECMEKEENNGQIGFLSQALTDCKLNFSTQQALKCLKANTTKSKSSHAFAFRSQGHLENVNKGKNDNVCSSSKYSKEKGGESQLSMPVLFNEEGNNEKDVTGLDNEPNCSTGNPEQIAEMALQMKAAAAADKDVKNVGTSNEQNGITMGNSNERKEKGETGKGEMRLETDADNGADKALLPPHKTNEIICLTPSFDNNLQDCQKLNDQGCQKLTENNDADKQDTKSDDAIKNLIKTPEEHNCDRDNHDFDSQEKTDDESAHENHEEADKSKANITISSLKSEPKCQQKWLFCPRKPDCIFWTQKPERMKRHLASHTDNSAKNNNGTLLNKHYCCPDCGERFSSLGRLLRHDRKSHGGPKEWECRICEAEITDINVHMRVSGTL